MVGQGGEQTEDIVDHNLVMWRLHSPDKFKTMVKAYYSLWVLHWVPPETTSKAQPANTGTTGATERLQFHSQEWLQDRCSMEGSM